MPKSEPSAPGDHTPVDNRPDYKKSGLSVQNMRDVGKSIMRDLRDASRAGYRDMTKGDMEQAQEISDAVPRRKD